MKLYLTMPKPGETIREGVIVKWLKKAGDAVEEKDPLVELETEKAVFTYESPFKGTIEQLMAEENDSKEVGAPIALFEVSEEDGQRYAMLGLGMAVETAAPPAKSVEIVAVKAPEPSAPMGAAKTAYSPLIRNLAKEHGLSNEELDAIPRSDSRGRLSKEDVLAYLQGRGGSAPAASAASGEKIPLSPIRQRIAQHMKKSQEQIPQAATSVDVDLSEIWEYCLTQGAAFQAKHGAKMSPFHFFLYAVREALKKFPAFNSSYGEENGKGYLLRHASIHLGFAVASPQGLFTPVVKDAERKDFAQLSRSLTELEKKAKEGRLSVDELTGATFVVNNPGAIGGVRCSQIIPLPMVAIVAMNRIAKRPWVLGDEIAIRHVAAVDLSFDHRPLDGADAILFLEELKKSLEHFPFEIVV